MKFLFALSIALSTAIAVTTTAKADDTSSGCGIGWQVTKKTTLFGSTTRNTTHAILPPTFGMTSGTSGCAQHPLVKKSDQQAVIFASTNLEPLRIEMAEGQGEYLQAFARTMGCSDSSLSRFSTEAQRHYKTIFNGIQNGTELLINVRKQIQADPQLALDCNNA